MDESRGRVVLGLDPGTASTGYGVVVSQGSRLQALEFGVVETPASLPLAERLAHIHTAVTALLERHKPEAAAVESLFFNVNVRTALAVGQARGVALLACCQSDCPVYEYTPQQVKQAVVGYGRADKQQVMEMVRVLLGLDERPSSDHAADALGVAICHLHTAGWREGVASALQRQKGKGPGD
ncbi:MAG: crossover junction endodeoxyribonuclease RuvC [Thermoleophilia bacterium]|nr:crossover junction endodeoxyribonuclease RuvC [Thermoleophilia bacterium]